MQISYAQNFEDVILWRALRHIDKGFYIDIGAQDPMVDSVSLAFYERGWRGVHVEPSPAYAQQLRVARPDEVVIEAVVGKIDGKATFYDIANSGLGTTCPANAAQHAESGKTVELRLVDSRPLSSLLDEYSERDIHWLKIDAEGGEEDVLASWDTSRVRPWILVIESTEPNSPRSTHEQWEHIVLALGYEFCYFDGLNRFYVSAEHPELKPAFGAGPNVFDAFALNGTASTWFCRKINAELDTAHSKAEEYLALSNELTARLSASEDLATSLRNETTQLTAALDDARERATRQEAAVDVLRRQLDAATERFVALSASADHATSLRTENTQLTAALEEARERATRQEATAEVLRRQLDAATERLVALSTLAGRQEATLRGQIATRDDKLSALEAQTARLSEHVASLNASTSWRLTAPMRGAKLAVGNIAVGKLPGSRTARKIARRLAGPVVATGVGAIERFPGIAPYVSAALAPFPVVRSKLKSVAVSRNLVPAAQPPPIVWMIEPEPNALSSWRKVFKPAGTPARR